MIDYAKYLQHTPNGVLATQDGNKVKTRVFQFLFADGNKAYFCTSSEKPVYSQLAANPNVSFCTYPQNFTPVVSINGKAVFVEEVALKERVLNENPLIKSIYQSTDNPIFKLFYLEITEVETFSLSEGLRIYKL